MNTALTRGNTFWRKIWSITFIIILITSSLFSPTLASKLSSANLVPGPTAAEAATPPPVWGIADTHNHQFANLGFGGLMIWGDVFRWDDDISKALPWSDFMPGKYGDVINWLGNSSVPDASAPSLDYPNIPATCPPGSGLISPCQGFSVHGPGGRYDLINTFLTGNFGHPVGGYPRFDGWPRWNSYTAQQVYYTWLERAWRDGGLRLMVMLAVNNEALCEMINRKAEYNCEDMPSIDRQIQAAKDLERFIDAKTPGVANDGWYRIAYTPQQAREIINAGKLAVVLGIETPSLFGCKVNSDCTDEYVLTELKRYRDMGVRQIYPLHNADNGFGGTGLYNDLFTLSNKVINGEWFDVTGDCDPKLDFHLDLLDSLQGDNGNDWMPPLVAWFLQLITGDNSLPARPPAGTNCNARGLQPLGETLINGLMDLHMIIDVDHLSTRTFNDIMALAEQRQYPGIIASHTGNVELGAWLGNASSIRYEANKTLEQLERIRDLGGNISMIIHQGDRSQVMPYARPDGSVPVPYQCGSSSEAWAQQYLYTVDHMNGGAVGLATDFNGLAGAPAPRFGPDRCHGDYDPGYTPANPVVYSDDPSQGLTKMTLGNRSPFDFNTDSFANMGMLPDFIQDVRNIGVSEADLAPLFNSAEAYIRMWELAGGDQPDPPNRAPYAHAGGPYLALTGTTINLQGSAQDLDGDPLTYSWDMDDNGIFETAGPVATFEASGINRDLPVVMRACDSHASNTQAACTNSRTFILVRTPGRLYAWGANVFGQLGVPPASVADCGMGIRCSPSAIPVPGFRDVIDVAAGTRNSVALKSDGTVWIWGATWGSTPVQINGFSDVVDISAGSEHILALKRNGSVWAWGLNNHGQIGTGDTTYRSTPVMVPGINNATAISAGDFFSLALLDNGAIVGWGKNQTRQLGNQCWPMGDPALPPADCLSPVSIPGFGGPNIVGIAAGSTWSHALDRDGGVFVQGGTDYQTGAARLTPARVGGLTRSVAIQAGFNDNVLSIRDYGVVHGYGRNNFGQAGPNCRDSKGFCWPFTETRVVAYPMAAVAAGSGHSLALTLSNGYVYAWGNNSYGQLGRDTWGEASLGVQEVSRMRGALAVAAGYDHSLAIVPTTVSITVHQGSPALFSFPGACGYITGCGFVSFPVADVVSEPTTFTYNYQEAPSTAAAADLDWVKFVGSSYTLTAQDANGNEITTFPENYTLMINYQDSDWQRAGVADEQDLNLAWWDAQAHEWRSLLPCLGCSLNTNYNVLTAKLDHLTEFALVGVDDTVAPTVTASYAPTPNAAGWTKADTVVTLTASDNHNGLGVDTVNYQTSGAQVSLPSVIHFNPATVTISAEGETDLAYYAVDRANNAGAPQEATIKLDKTSPVTQIALNGYIGQNGWYTSNVTATLTSTDRLSGVKGIEHGFGGVSFEEYTQPVVISNEGNLLLYGRSIDVAGNTENPSISAAFKIDKTAPLISINYPAAYAVLPVNVLLDFGAVDATSGIQSVSGTLSDGETTISVNSGATISQAGIYTLVVQATDVAGLTASETRYFVVFDPAGGYVTGGGLIDSPAGAYQPDLSLSGKATFAFLSKYVKGALTPSGTTRFQFHVADLNFFSDSYEWLVVNQAGTNAQFKGSGTINRAGNYKFMLWAGDGEPDTYRIKIWEEVNGVEIVVYDNGIAQPVSGGAIVIHKK